MSDLTLTPIPAPFRVSMRPPGSKSLTNRALVLAALADGTSELSNVLFADDTLVMLESLGRLGFRLGIDRAAHAVTVHGGGGGVPAASADLFCGNSGTTIRFLAALCALGRGRYNLDGIGRMRQRPIGQLGEMLRTLGVDVRWVMNEGFPPIEILADGLPGGDLRFESRQSSQFLSAVLQVSPYARRPVRIDLEGRQTSWPYVAMTLRLMGQFGVTATLTADALGEPRRIVVPAGKYAATQYAVEPDASNASYFLAAATLCPGASLTIEGLGKGSLQGDVGFADLLHRMGAGLLFGHDFITVLGAERLIGIDADLLAMPDMAQTLAVVALFAEGRTILRNLHTLRLKETDRVAALAAELTKLGGGVRLDGDDMIVTPPAEIRPAAIETYDDHRMAMSFAVAGTKATGVTIKDIECVNKTYPDFFADLAKLAGSGTR